MSSIFFQPCNYGWDLHSQVFEPCDTPYECAPEPEQKNENLDVWEVINTQKDQIFSDLVVQKSPPAQLSSPIHTTQNEAGDLSVHAPKEGNSHKRKRNRKRMYTKQTSETEKRPIFSDVVIQEPPPAQLSSQIHTKHIKPRDFSPHVPKDGNDKNRNKKKLVYTIKQTSPEETCESEKSRTASQKDDVVITNVTSKEESNPCKNLPTTEEKQSEQKLFPNVCDSDVMEVYLNDDLENTLLSLPVLNGKVAWYENLLNRYVQCLNSLKVTKIRGKLNSNLKLEKALQCIKKHFDLIEKAVISSTDAMMETLKEPAKMILHSSQSIPFAEEILCQLAFKNTDSFIKQEIQSINMMLKNPDLTEMKLELAKLILKKMPEGINWLEIGCNIYDFKDDKSKLIARDYFAIFLKKKNVIKNCATECGKLLKIIEQETNHLDIEGFQKYGDICKSISLQEVLKDPNTLIGSFQNIYYNLLKYSANTTNEDFKVTAFFFFCENFYKVKENDLFLLEDAFNYLLTFINNNLKIEAIKKIFVLMNQINSNGPVKSNLLKKDYQMLVSNEIVSTILDYIFNGIILNLSSDSKAKDVTIKQLIDFAMLGNKEFGFCVNKKFIKTMIDYCERNKWENIVEEEILISILVNSATLIPGFCKSLSRESHENYQDQTIKFFQKCIKNGMKNFKSLELHIKNDAFINFLDLFRITQNEDVAWLSEGIDSLASDANFLLKNRDASNVLMNLLIKSQSFWGKKPENFWFHWYVLDVVLPNDNTPFKIEFPDSKRKGLVLLANQLALKKEAYEKNCALKCVSKNYKEFEGYFDDLIECYLIVFSAMIDGEKNYKETFDHWVGWAETMDWAKIFNLAQKQKSFKKDRFLEFLDYFVDLNLILASAKIASINSDKLLSVDNTLKNNRKVICKIFEIVAKFYNKNLVKIEDKADWINYQKISISIIEFVNAPAVYLFFNDSVADSFYKLAKCFKELIEEAKYEAPDKNELMENWEKFKFVKG